MIILMPNARCKSELIIQVLLMEMNLQMRRYCLTCRQSQHKRTHSQKYARNTRARTNHTAVRRVDKSRSQGHGFALNAIWPSAHVRKLLSSNYRTRGTTVVTLEFHADETLSYNFLSMSSIVSSLFYYFIISQPCGWITR